MRKTRGPLRRTINQTYDVSELEQIDAPLNEGELIAQWTSHTSCLVSICMLTYNHAPWLRNTLSGILNQKTDFGFEILIHDDASTDGSQDIIREFQARYPRIIKPILQQENKWSQGINPSIEYNYPRANAEFVAWCEGDDMWIDKHKLALQVEGLRSNPSINLAFHQAIQIHYGLKGVKPLLIGNYSSNDRVVSFREVIHRPHGLIPTASCMVRSAVKQRLFEFMKSRPYIRGGDIFLQMFGSIGSGALYHAKPMSIYRFQTKHSLTRGIQEDVVKLANHQAAAIRAYIEIDSETHGSLTHELKTLIFQRILWLFNRRPVPPGVVMALNLNTLLKEYIKIKHNIRKKISELNKSPNSHVIYGIASGCTLIMQRLDQEKVLSIIDRDGKWVGEYIFGKKIQSDKEIGNFRSSNLIISTLAPDKMAIERLIDEYDFPAGNLVYFFDDLIEAIDIKGLSQDAHDAHDHVPGTGQPLGWWSRRVLRTFEPGQRVHVTHNPCTDSL